MSEVLTPAALQHLTVAELRVLYREAQWELAASPAGSPARRDALASLENLSRALRLRLSQAPRP